MAGIGFKLQKLFQEDYFSARLKAYAFAGLVTSGPWLIVIVTIALTQWLTTYLSIASFEERTTFNLTISYCFIFSQVILGIQQLVVTRYLADCFYEKRYKEIFPTFIGMTKMTIAIAAVFYVIFLTFSELPFLSNLLILILFLTINLIWVQFLFLSAAKFYQAVAYSFLGGAAVSIISVLLIDRFLMPYLTAPFATSMALTAGFTLGMLVTLFGLFTAMLLTFPNRETKDPFSYLSYFDRHPALFWTSFLYNIGVWVSNWVIWFSEGGAVHLGTFRYHPVYDTAIFLSYLTVIPTMTIFVISVETRFYERYRVFYGYVNEGGTLQQINKAKGAMLLILRQELQRLVRNQGLFTLFVLIFASTLLSSLALSKETISIFQMTTIGAFSNAMVLVLTLLLLYFEDQRGACITSLLFFAVNGVFAVALAPFGYDGFGLSFALGSTVTFAYALIRLIQYVNEIDYHTFCRYEPRERSTRFTRVGERLNRRSA
ncbi:MULTISPECIES: exopolysaccharide Pel transporter PelG [unclassified Exiguobacterium]|uniref:exopolysaccharide Pel transporter PelG n=1 Tax=unclassified Exiguobacterium TaxID=2644629 RepID=UPI001BEC52D2|nr:MULTISPECIES: exopolysaccharide Pel transporter PelG [unclassified Exiguobacterium]